MEITTEIGSKSLAELVAQVEAGHEVLLTKGNKPIARLVSPRERNSGNGHPLRVRSLRGHQVLTPIVSQEALAEELFDRQ